MTDVTEMPKYDGMEYEELVIAAQYMWMENAKLHEYVTKLEQANIVLDSNNTELLNDMRDMQMIVSDNHKLRELCKSMRCALADFDDKVYLAALDETLIGAGFDLQELGIETEAY